MFSYLFRSPRIEEEKNIWIEMLSVFDMFDHNVEPVKG